MVRFFSILSLLCIVLSGQAQVLPLDGQRYADSLHLNLQQNTQDSVKARTSFLLAEYWSAQDSVKARQYLQQGAAYGKQSPYLLAVSRYYDALITGHTDPVRATALYLSTDTLLQTFHGPEAALFRAKCWHNYAILRKLKDDHKAYTDILLSKVIPLAKEAGDSIYVGKNYLDLAIGFKNTGQYSAAEPWLLKAIGTMETAHAPAEQIIPAYHTIAENYVLSGNNSKAAAYLDSMRILLTPYPLAADWLDYYAADAMRLTVNRQFDASLQQIEKGIALARQLKAVYEEQRLQLQKFYALYNKGSFAQARDVMFDLSKHAEFMALAVNRLQMDYGLAVVFQGMGNMANAYNWMSAYATLSDSVNDSKLKTDMAAMEEKYHDAENRQEIARLEASRKQATLAIHNQRLTNGLLASIVVVLLITFAFAMYYYRNTRKLALNKVKELEQQQALHVAQALLEGEERERSRVARDLHDGLGGMLAGVKIKMTSYESDSRLHAVIEHLDKSMNELRRIARNMMPESLLKFGLETALRDLCESMMTAGRQIEFQTFDIEKEMPVNVQVAIYRIVQEALSNAIRHGDASRIILQCSQNNNMFFITLEDNGKGFDVKQTYKGIGLGNIRNRVEYMNGKLEITSVINEGTVINIELDVA